MVVRVINGCCEGGLEWKGLAGRRAELRAQSSEVPPLRKLGAWEMVSEDGVRLDME
jgi:hypothetical protein